MTELRTIQTVAARSLEFMILTAARTGETIGAVWPEMDRDGATWTIPPERMKAGAAHRVPLVSEAVAILDRQLERTPRPAPPDEFTDEQAAEWRAVVGPMPADWFARETYPFLVQYCRQVVAARRIHQLIKVLQTDEELKAWHDALKMRRGGTPPSGSSSKALFLRRHSQPGPTQTQFARMVASSCAFPECMRDIGAAVTTSGDRM